MPTINQLSTASSISDSDLVPMFSQSNGDARKTSFGSIADYINARNAASNAIDNIVTQYQNVSITGQSIQINDMPKSVFLIFTAVGAPTNFTINFPSVGSTFDGQEVVMVYIGTIGSSYVLAPSGILIKGWSTSMFATGSYSFCKFRFDAGTNNWYRIG